VTAWQGLVLRRPEVPRREGGLDLRHVLRPDNRRLSLFRFRSTQSDGGLGPQNQQTASRKKGTASKSAKKTTQYAFSLKGNPNNQSSLKTRQTPPNKFAPAKLKGHRLARWEVHS